MLALEERKGLLNRDVDFLQGVSVRIASGVLWRDVFLRLREEVYLCGRVKLLCF